MSKNPINKDQYRLMTIQKELNKVIITKTILDSERLKLMLKEYSSLLSTSIFQACLKRKQIKCKVCKNLIKKAFIVLPCSHIICSVECFIILKENFPNINTKSSFQLKCKCKSLIPEEISNKLLNPSIALNQSPEPVLKCGICTEFLIASKFITLECDHRYCKSCTKEYLEALINDGKIGNDLSCPECGRPVDFQIIFDNLDKKTQEKYQKFLIRDIKVKEGEVFVSCIGRPGVDCEYSQIISADREDYSCPSCNTRFCPKCKLDVHPSMSCKQRKMIENNEDSFIKESLANGTMFLCPWCEVPIEKDLSGCKYMTCKSHVCKSKKFFCWDCKKKLNKFHEKHLCVTPEVPTNRCVVW